MANCCDYTPGMLREPVTFQKQVKTSIGGGATQITYTDDFSARCHIKPLSGGERLYAERLDAQTRNRAVIRYDSRLTESHRAVIRGRAYQIRYIGNVEFRNRWMELDLDGGVAT